VELHEILHMYPLGLEIRASVHGYAWPRFDVKIHFVYMVAFGGRIFMEVHGKSRETVLKAKEYLWSHEFHREITVPYNQLRPQY